MLAGSTKTGFFKLWRAVVFSLQALFFGVEACLMADQKKGYNFRLRGGVPERLMGADCKSVGLRLRWFESSLLHQM